MESYKNTSSEIKYAVAKNEDLSILHIGELSPGTEISTGQPILEIYETKQEVIDIYGQAAIDQLDPVMDEDILDIEMNI